VSGARGAEAWDPPLAGTAATPSGSSIVPSRARSLSAWAPVTALATVLSTSMSRTVRTGALRIVGGAVDEERGDGDDEDRGERGRDDAGDLGEEGDDAHRDGDEPQHEVEARPAQELHRARVAQRFEAAELGHEDDDREPVDEPEHDGVGDDADELAQAEQADGDLEDSPQRTTAGKR
jgi:hypothetical protein